MQSFCFEWISFFWRDLYGFRGLFNVCRYSPKTDPISYTNFLLVILLWSLTSIRQTMNMLYYEIWFENSNNDNHNYSKMTGLSDMVIFFISWLGLKHEIEESCLIAPIMKRSILKPLKTMENGILSWVDAHIGNTYNKKKKFVYY